MLIWSAGCSSGEEPYTLAMVLSEYRRRIPLSFPNSGDRHFDGVLEKASRGIFNAEVVTPVPSELQRKYFMRSRDHDSRLVAGGSRNCGSSIEFRQPEPHGRDFGLPKWPTPSSAATSSSTSIGHAGADPAEILRTVCCRGGYTFMGHSETLHRMDLPLVPVAPALYRKTDGQT